MLCFTLNLQGGSPLGYGNKGWINSAFDCSGALRIKYIERWERILSKADELGMVVILGYFYFGQDEQLKDENIEDGYQSIPVDWGIHSKRKIAFFSKLKEITSEEKATHINNSKAKYSKAKNK